MSFPVPTLWLALAMPRSIPCHEVALGSTGLMIPRWNSRSLMRRSEDLFDAVAGRLGPEEHHGLLEDADDEDYEKAVTLQAFHEAKQGINRVATPIKCAEDGEPCSCTGTMYFGLRYCPAPDRPDGNDCTFAAMKAEPHCHKSSTSTSPTECSQLRACTANQADQMPSESEGVNHAMRCWCESTSTTTAMPSPATPGFTPKQKEELQQIVEEKFDPGHNSINAAVDDTTKEIEDLESGIAQQNEEIETVQSRMALDSNVTDLQTQLGNLSSTVVTHSNMNELKEEIEDLHSHSQETNNEVQAMSQSIGEAKSELQTLHSEAALKGDVAELRAEVGNLQGVVALNSNVAEVKAEVQTLQSHEQDMSNAVQALKTSIEALKEKLLQGGSTQGTSTQTTVAISQAAKWFGPDCGCYQTAKTVEENANDWWCTCDYWWSSSEQNRCRNCCGQTQSGPFEADKTKAAQICKAHLGEGTTAPCMTQKYTRRWPHCTNLGNCFGPITLGAAKATCLATPACDGFSWLHAASASGNGCYKANCSPENGGFGSGSHDYWVKDSCTSPANQCDAQQLEKCMNNFPCVDLREGPSHHHIMRYLGTGSAEVRYYDGQWVHDQRWYTCTSSDAAANSLVGTWNCPNFYNSLPITITPDYADDFTSTRQNDHVEYCSPH